MDRVRSGAIASLADLIAERDVTSVLVVTDADIVEMRGMEISEWALTEPGATVDVFDGMKSEPKFLTAEASADRLREGGHDLVVGVGGDSAMNTAKFASVLAEHDIPTRELVGMDTVPSERRPIALVPATAGTGSEVTKIRVFGDEADGGAKKGVYFRHLFADLAAVNHTLTVSMPSGVAATSGMDALTHIPSRAT